MTYPEMTNWTWDPDDVTHFDLGYLIKVPISTYYLPRLTPQLKSSRNFTDTCGKIKYTVENPDYWDFPNDPYDPENIASFTSIFSNLLPTKSVGEVTKPSFDVFTLQSLKAKIEFPFYETYNFTVSA